MPPRVDPAPSVDADSEGAAQPFCLEMVANQALIERRPRAAVMGSQATPRAKPMPDAEMSGYFDSRRAAAGYGTGLARSARGGSVHPVNASAELAF